MLFSSALTSKLKPSLYLFSPPSKFLVLVLQSLLLPTFLLPFIGLLYLRRLSFHLNSPHYSKLSSPLLQKSLSLATLIFMSMIFNVPLLLIFLTFLMLLVYHNLFLSPHMIPAILLICSLLALLLQSSQTSSSLEHLYLVFISE